MESAISRAFSSPERSLMKQGAMSIPEDTSGELQYFPSETHLARRCHLTLGFTDTARSKARLSGAALMPPGRPVFASNAEPVQTVRQQADCSAAFRRALMKAPSFTRRLAPNPPGTRRSLGLAPRAAVSLWQGLCRSPRRRRRGEVPDAVLRDPLQGLGRAGEAGCGEPVGKNGIDIHAEHQEAGLMPGE